MAGAKLSPTPTIKQASSTAMKLNRMAQSSFPPKGRPLKSVIARRKIIHPRPPDRTKGFPEDKSKTSNPESRIRKSRLGRGKAEGNHEGAKEDKNLDTSAF
jgi:hypothetical protein